MPGSLLTSADGPQGLRNSHPRKRASRARQLALAPRTRSCSATSGTFPRTGPVEQCLSAAPRRADAWLLLLQLVGMPPGRVASLGELAFNLGERPLAVPAGTH